MKKGFTLIELMVVVCITAILAALIAPNAIKYIKQPTAKNVERIDGMTCDEVRKELKRLQESKY